MLPFLLKIRPPAHQQAIFDVMPGPSRIHSWWSRQRDLHTVLRKFISTQATRDHDRIYALLGLCNTEERAIIPIDYTRSFQDVIKDTISAKCLSGTHVDINSSIRLKNLQDLVHLLPIVPFLGFLEWCKQAEAEFLAERSGETSWDEADWVEQWRKSLDVPTFLQDVAPEWRQGGGFSRTQAKRWIERKFTKLRITPKSMPCWLIQAAKDRSEPIVRLLLDLGANLHHADSEGQTALHEGSKNGSRAVVETLLARGADPQTKNLSGRNSIDEAEKGGRSDIAKLLLYNGGGSNGTAILEACVGGKETLVQSLLDKGASTVKTNDRGESPLLLAVRERHVGVVRLLLDKGTDLNMADKGGVSSLLEAVKQKSIPMVQLLLLRGAFPYKADKSGEAPLLLATRKRHFDILQLLLSKRADPNMGDNQGVTLLLEAVKQDSDYTVRLLLDWGANCNQPDKGGLMPLALGNRRGRPGVIQLLKQRGARDEIVKTEASFNGTGI